MVESTSQELHISSLILQFTPPHSHAIQKQLQAFPEIEISHIEDSIGKIIVTMETNTHKKINHIIDHLQQFDGMLSVSMVYHHAEDADSLNKEIL
ncbi:MAG: nitrate reductase NapD [Flavobacteriales bacterium]|jgi:nitrate reductase NapD